MTFGQQKYNDLKKVKETSHLSRKTLSIFFWPKQKLREAKLYLVAFLTNNNREQGELKPFLYQSLTLWLLQWVLGTRKYQSEK